MSSGRGGAGPSKQKDLLRKAEIGSYTCCFCGKTFHSKQALIDHTEAIHPEIFNSNEYFDCKHCANYWRKGEEVNCTFLDECPYLMNKSKEEGDEMLIKQYKEEKKGNVIVSFNEQIVIVILMLFKFVFRKILSICRYGSGGC